jgi:hypothetical protein
MFIAVGGGAKGIEEQLYTMLDVINFVQGPITRFGWNCSLKCTTQNQKLYKLMLYNQLKLAT